MSAIAGIDAGAGMKTIGDINSICIQFWNQRGI